MLEEPDLTEEWKVDLNDAELDLTEEWNADLYDTEGGDLCLKISP
jgi:hypothetical protein